MSPGKKNSLAKNREFEYVMGGQVLEKVESEKDVGVMIHQSLKPSLQCAKAAGKANQVLGQLSRSITYRDKQTFLKLYKVYVRPHLEYAVASWCPWNKADKEILEKVQKRAVSMVSNFQATTYESKLLESGMTTLEKRRERGDLIMMYRIMTGKDDVHYSTWFEKMTDRENGATTRTTSGFLNVVPPGLCSGDLRRNFFSIRVVKPWNNLPDQVKQAETVNTFKNRLDKITFPRALRDHPL